MPKVIDPDEKRREILAAAATTFSRHGYRGTNLQSVAAAAGMGKSSLYHYFPTRDALFDALMQRLLQEEVAVFDQLVAAPGSATQRFDRLVAAVIDLLDEWVKAGPLLVDFLHDERGRRALRDTFRRVRKAMARLIADGQRAGEFRDGDANALATVVIGCLDGVLLQRLLEPAAGRDGRVAAELQNILRLGLAGFAHKAVDEQPVPRPKPSPLPEFAKGFETGKGLGKGRGRDFLGKAGLSRGGKR